MNMNALPIEDCPFCGGKAKCSEEETNTLLGTDYYLYVYCDSCGIRTPKIYFSLNNKEEADALIKAVRLWNRRCNDGSNS